MNTQRQPLDDTFHDALAQAAERLAVDGVGAEDAVRRVSEAVQPAIEAAGADLAETLVRRAPDMLRERSQLHRGFSDRLRQHWQAASTCCTW